MRSKDQRRYAEGFAASAIPLTASFLFLYMTIATAGVLRWPLWMLLVSLTVSVATVISGVLRGTWPHPVVLVVGGCLLGVAGVISFLGSIIP